MPTLAIDFGTSNSAAGVAVNGCPYLIPMPDGETTLPTSVFFDPTRKQTSYGNAANAALIAGREGRFMRALKSVLGTPLMHERRVIAHERLTLIAVVARFLAMLKAQAEAQTGLTFDAVLSGRPVRFHPDPDRDARAQDDLRLAYTQAGFTTVDFLFEPEAAALTSGPLARGELGLIVDIGGGTSDFSIFERDGDATRIIASEGVRVGGTDFDRALSISHVMPLLGRGGAIRNEMGPGQTIAPNALFNDLATWEKIAFLYTPETLRLAQRMARQAVDRDAFDRLVTLIETETGHDVAFAVEAGKIAANRAPAAIDLAVIEPRLTAPLTPADLAHDLSDHTGRIATGARDTLAKAGIGPERIARVVYVGGSSLMGTVGQAMTDLFPDAAQERANAFTAVADGLCLAAA